MVVHTNVSEYEEDWKRLRWQKTPKWNSPLLTPAIWRRVGWMLTAILAPELVAWNAFEPRRIVKKTTKEVQQYLDDWTDTHSWFALMGGFAFDITHAPEPFFPDDRGRLATTPKGIKEIAERWPHLLQDTSLSQSQIRARGKADGLTKFLAYWQATWFCVQCIFRLSSGLAISFLEPNVFAHAICALLIYGLRWEKLKDVTEPHLLASSQVHEAAATLCSLGSASQKKYHQLGATSGYTPC